jgi:hypothetical protein
MHKHRRHIELIARRGRVLNAWATVGEWTIVLVTIERASAEFDTATRGQTVVETACPAPSRNGMAGGIAECERPGAKERSDSACVVRNTDP